MPTGCKFPQHHDSDSGTALPVIAVAVVIVLVVSSAAVLRVVTDVASLVITAEITAAIAGLVTLGVILYRSLQRSFLLPPTRREIEPRRPAQIRHLQLRALTAADLAQMDDEQVAAWATMQGKSDRDDTDTPQR